MSYGKAFNIVTKKLNYNTRIFKYYQMQKSFIIMFMALVVLSACRKSDYTILKSHDSDQKYDVSFTTTTTTKSAYLPTSSNDVKPEYTRIYNLDEGGTIVSVSKTGTQLAAGNYVAVFVYSNTFFSRVYGIGGISEVFTFDGAFFDTRLSVATQSGAINDIFYKKVYFKVKHKAVSQNVELDRIVADLEVSIQDEMPANVSRLELSVNDLAVFKFNTELRESAVTKTKNFSATEKKLNAYVLGQGPRQVTVRAYDATGGMLKEKSTTATFVAGQKTLVSLNLFGDITSFATALN
ncbi:MAG TPA: hypothetical protein VGB63_08070 [Pedobacter sp.]